MGPQVCWLLVCSKDIALKEVHYSSAFYTVQYLYKANAIAAVMVLEETKGRRSCLEDCHSGCLLGETLRLPVSVCKCRVVTLSPWLQLVHLSLCSVWYHSHSYCCVI